MQPLKVGVVGYCPPSVFDQDEAHRMIAEAFDRIATEYPEHKINIVSGLSDVGIPSIAYHEAVRRGWRTVGIACKKAYEHPVFPVDEELVVGEKWGDESPDFLESIDMIVRVGGGKQSQSEVEQTTSAGKPAIVYDLPTIS